MCIHDDCVRVWIVATENWQPRTWHDVPPHAVAVELAEDRCFSTAEATAYVEGFNSAQFACSHLRWAVAVRVRLRVVGDLSPKQSVSSEGLLDLSALPNRRR